MTRKDMRLRVRRFKANQKALRTSTLQGDYRRLTVLAHLTADSLPKNASEVLRSLALPGDYIRIVDHLCTCSPKTRRIANHCLDFWDGLDSRVYIGIMKRSFFDDAGELKPRSIDKLFADLHQALLDEARSMRKGPTKMQ